MKNFSLLSSMILFSSLFLCKSFCQSDLPKSIINASAGLGQSYGGAGIKTVTGYKNSGLLLGCGFFGPGIYGYKIGGQICIEWFYAEIGYGLVAMSSVNGGPLTPINAGSIIVGGMIGLGRAKRVFIDLGIGHSFGAPKLVFFNQTMSMDVFCFNIGAGYRFGDWSKLK